MSTSTNDSDNPQPKMLDDIVDQAKKRFTRCETWESNARKLMLEDIKFANADTDNGWQWPNKIKINRDIDERPVLTINKTRQHNLQIINDAKQNKPSVKIRPVGGGATYEASQVFEGIIRHIEYISNAQSAYDTATKFQVEGGLGFLRVVTDYANDESFDQEIFIRRIRDPFTVYLDPDAQEADKSDARFGFVFDDMPKDDFKLAYPDYLDLVGDAALGNGDGWIDQDHIRVCEYYRTIEKKDKLLAITDPTTGQVHVIKHSDIPQELRSQAIDDPATKVRNLTLNEIEWYLIAGNEIIDKKKWPGKYIPIIAVIGEEVIVNGEMDRKGHTRALKDPQRIYNYWSSSSVEFVALQGKSPYIAPARAIEGLETYWRTANTSNTSILPYNDIDDEGMPIQMPQRAQPPQIANAYVEGMKIAREEMMEVSGQYQSQFGAPGNEKSGKAINERQRQGDNATYHFIDNLAVSIRYLGKILLDLIPKIYDTKRVLRILAEDGEESQVQLDPKAQAAHQQQAKMHGNAAMAIFNPNVGKYDVMSDVGPAYATKRQEAFNAMTQIVTQAPQLVNVIGDLLFKNADFPGADKIAERLERMVPPQAKGEGPNPEVTQLQQQLQHMTGLLNSMTNQLAEHKLKLTGKDQLRDVEIYDAYTKRLSALEKVVTSPKEYARMLHELALQEHSSNLNAASASVDQQLQEDTEQPNAPPQ